MQKWPEQLKFIKEKISAKTGKKRLSRQAIGDFLDVSRGKVQAWDNGQRPNADDLATISHKLNLDAHWLLTGEGHPDASKIPPLATPSPCPMASPDVRQLAHEPELLDGEHLVTITGPQMATTLILGSDKIPVGFVYASQAEDYAEDWAAIPVAEPWLTADGTLAPSKKLSPMAFRRSECDRWASSWKHLTWVPVPGQDMQPHMASGDMALVDTGATQIMVGKIYLLEIGGAVVFRFSAATSDGLKWGRSNPENTSLPISEYIPADAAHVLGRVLRWCHEG